MFQSTEEANERRSEDKELKGRKRLKVSVGFECLAS